MTELNKLAKSIYEQNKSKGFWEGERNFGELLMLVTSELAEALEAHRDGKWTVRKDKEELAALEANASIYPDLKAEYEKEWVLKFKNTIKNSVNDEVADALIRILDLCGGLGIDIDYHVAQKLKYNRTRPNKHGRAY
jgi:NTP pyrophosphatase (non-canonical NTP hydrolase)